MRERPADGNGSFVVSPEGGCPSSILAPWELVRLPEVLQVVVILYQGRKGGGDHTSWVLVRVWWCPVLGGLLGMQCPLSYSIISICQGDPFWCPRTFRKLSAFTACRSSLSRRQRLGSARRLSRPRTGETSGEEMGVGTWHPGRMRVEIGRGFADTCRRTAGGPTGQQARRQDWQARAAGNLKLSADLKHQQSMWRLGLHAPNICTRSSGIASPPAYR